MSESLAIKVENLSKAYRLGQYNTGAISEDLHRWWAQLRGKEDPYLRIGEQNDRTKKGDTNRVWSLQDINFEVKQGEAIGIIGRNGAGKSTLLKILSRVTAPTTGNVFLKGRVASLLEVGTGFHPELTGRENIFLNGAILGMRKAEIKQRFDEIVEFAGVARYVDTPVKRYSSGMYVRLAFAVAAHLESQILIVDEVLAVGDADFQKKCMGKMNEISTGQGRTILFVSHNMESILSLCENSILLKQGLIHSTGTTPDVISKYLSDKEETTTNKLSLEKLNESASYYQGLVRMLELEFTNALPDTNIVSWDEELELKLTFEVTQDLEKLFLGFTITNQSNVNIGTVNNRDREFKIEKGIHTIHFKVKNHLRHGSYNLHLGAKEKGVDVWWHVDIGHFLVSKHSNQNNAYPEGNAGITRFEATMNLD